MNILVFSDSHGCVGPMAELSRELKPDMVLHLGDHAADAADLRQELGSVPVYIVRGNCDFGSDSPDSRILTAGGLRLFMTHGHRYGVKRSIDSLLLAARAEGANVVLFGHTHRRLFREFGALKVINPGSFGSDGTYASLEISGGVISAEILGMRDGDCF